MKTGKILLLIIIILGIISYNTNQKKPPMAKQGILDLRNWDFEKDGNVRLDGEWEFYWHEFLSSKDFDTVKQKHYIKVPKPWNDYKWGNEELGYEGYATYRLRIIVNDKTKEFGLKFPDQGTAFELYLNDSLVGKNGKIGKTKETSVPQYKPLLIPFERNGDTIIIVCQVSNFDFHQGGLYFIPLLGNEESINIQKYKISIIDYIITTSLILIALILLIFFILRPKDYLSLIFSFGALFSAIRTVTVNERIIYEIFPGLSWEWAIKLEGLSWFLFGTLVFLGVRLLFKKEVSKFALVFFPFSFGLISIITLLTKSEINSHFLPYIFVIAGLNIVYVLIIMIIAIFKKRDGSIIIFIGFIPFIIGAVNELLYYNYLVSTKSIITLPFGLLIVSLSHTVLLSRLFSRSYKRVENYANDLKIEVEERTKDLILEKEKTVELLKKSDKLLLNVLPEQIANRLKEGETTIADHFEEASVIFIDIADFTKLSAKSSPQMMVKMLNEIFTIFDKIAAKYGLEKIKTIGDCYMAAAGIPVPRSDHAEAIAKMALDVMKTMKDYTVETHPLIPSQQGKTRIQFRIGLDCGPIVAGVIGEQKFIYDLWGDMVNTASRMETNGIIGRIQCTERFKEKLSVVSSPLSDKNDGNVLLTTDNRQLATKFEERGEIEIKGKGKMKTWFLIDI